MTQSEENGRLIQYVEITNLDSNKQFNLVYLKDQSLIDLQLVFERDENFYTFNEIIKEVDFFTKKLAYFLISSMKRLFVLVMLLSLVYLLIMKK
ncbi:hypothetical protein [Acinetobacter baumannii]|nr:hypothetical protein [Acinetobacter baumannii]UEL55043.1 hypothetical protein JWB57_19965 [Acinetobacter baumannii]UMO22848.1 hypothetical protein L2Z38_06070 [Acinetobacter baumannii]